MISSIHQGLKSLNNGIFRQFSTETGIMAFIFGKASLQMATYDGKIVRTIEDKNVRIYFPHRWDVRSVLALEDNSSRVLFQFRNDQENALSVRDNEADGALQSVRLQFVIPEQLYEEIRPALGSEAVIEGPIAKIIREQLFEKYTAALRIVDEQCRSGNVPCAKVTMEGPVFRVVELEKIPYFKDL